MPCVWVTDKPLRALKISNWDFCAKCSGITLKELPESTKHGIESLFNIGVVTFWHTLLFLFDPLYSSTYPGTVNCHWLLPVFGWNSLLICSGIWLEIIGFCVREAALRKFVFGKGNPLPNGKRSVCQGYDKLCMGLAAKWSGGIYSAVLENLKLV